MRGTIKFLYAQPKCLSCSRDLSTARKNSNSGDSTFVNFNTDRSYGTRSGALDACVHALVDDGFVNCKFRQPYYVSEMYHVKCDVSACLVTQTDFTRNRPLGMASNNIRQLHYLQLFYLNDIHKA